MRRKLLFFLAVALALLVAKAPARLVDGLVAHATDGGLRLLTHGGEVLATLAPREPWRLPIGRVA